MVRFLNSISTSSAFLLLALLSLLAAILGGIVSSLFYLPDSYGRLKRLGIQMQQAHSVHTSFVLAWLCLAAMAMIYAYLEDSEGLTRAEVGRARTQLFLWTVAGIGILASLLNNIYSGREYIEYHPIFSLLILAGWLCFARTFLGRIWKNFWHSPVYVYMWGVSAVFFIYTYLEAQLWLLPSVSRYPLADLQLQWKSLGALIGAINLLVYGSAIYLGERLTGNREYGQSRLAFRLFYVGLLNSFTNYTHHTYHLPQSLTVRWIGFIVSMTEVLILARALQDLTKLLRSSKVRNGDTEVYLVQSKSWTVLNLLLAICLSIPPVNTLVHGTHVVVAHAMGSMIGIDTFLLFAVVTWLLGRMDGVRAPSIRMRMLAWSLSFSLAVLVLSLVVSGAGMGLSRYLDDTPPTWLMLARTLFAISGTLFGVLVIALVSGWTRRLLAYGATKLKPPIPFPVASPGDVSLSK